ncbi:hypothetical protein AR687_01830 [Flavobacteriaceae bacterium CRH]|nr:hypothetical protein AR687_01830 [Flavobacteriaceae bacterium CRH]
MIEKFSFDIFIFFDSLLLIEYKFLTHRNIDQIILKGTLQSCHPDEGRIALETPYSNSLIFVESRV